MEYEAECLENSGEAIADGEAAVQREDPPFLQTVKMRMNSQYAAFPR